MAGKLHFAEKGESMEIRYRWFGAGTVTLLVFALAWNAFIVGFAFVILAEGTPPQILQFVLFSLLFVAIGLASLYAAIAYLRNSTFIRISSDAITVRHGPVYWGKPVVYDPADLAAVLLRERVYWKNQAKKRYVYKLLLQMEGGAEKIFLRLEEPGEAKRLGETLADYTGVPLRR
ncbi:MAG: hypothetical protein GVY10_09335 [Verrucomicrobia bacterium]|jgi:hypothetical protein|nr:hypothetical protein [Verrucomicrobiota bacterium]